MEIFISCSCTRGISHTSYIKAARMTSGGTRYSIFHNKALFWCFSKSFGSF